MSEGKITLKTYFAVFATLLVLTAVTVGVAFLDLGRFNTAVALAIAGFKATLVILYFMHIRYSDKLTWVVVGSGFYWLLVLIVITLSDYIARLYLG